MVLKSFVHLARQGFPKGVTHGYAQSLVAASQSSHASSTTQLHPFSHHPASKFGKSGSSQLRDALQNNPASSSTGTKTGEDGDLDRYYAAYTASQREQRGAEAREWQQFQFTKRIGWRTPAAAFEVKVKGKEKEEDVVQPSDSFSRQRRTTERAYTTSAVDDFKEAREDFTEDLALAQVNEAIAKEISDLQKASGIASTVLSAIPVSQDEVDADLTSPAAQELSDSSTTARSTTLTLSPASHETADTPTEGPESSPHLDRICYLQNARKYAEIPPIFESMLRTGHLPPAKAYNGLLTAAINLPSAKHQTVLKALDVYSDMLRRKVLPDTTTYTILLELLSRRALEVSQMKTSLDEDKIRFGVYKDSERFMFRSQEAEYDMLVEDDALNVATKLFMSSIMSSDDRKYGSETYRLLLNACAVQGEVEHMIRIYSHMESHKVLPYASIYAPMIKAFAASGDLRSAVECYDEYKSLAIADDHGKLSIIDRRDDQVYAAVVKAYAMCGKQLGARKFFTKVVDSFPETGAAADRLQTIRDTVVLDALIEERLDCRNFGDALRIAEEQEMSEYIHARAMALICTKAADHSDIDAASKAYLQTSSIADDTSVAAIAMLAMYIRRGDVDAARSAWSTLATTDRPMSAFIEPTAMYAVALIGSGNVDEGLMEARQSFSRIRSSVNSSSSRSDTTEQIDEGIEFIGSFLASNNVVPSPSASMSFMWAMIENGGLVSPVAEQLLAGLGPEEISKLSWQDLKLALQVEAGIVAHERGLFDVAHSARLAHLLETSLANRMPLDQRTSELVDRSISRLSHQRPDLAERWHNYKLPVMHQPLHLPTNPIATAPTSFSESFDPYAATTDHRGSSIIVDELENGGAKGAANLNEALMRFRNIRRAGRHPRYIAYAKLISAAARDGRTNLVHDILGMARQDIPLLPQHTTVRHGWALILDAMVGACLTLGNRRMAAEYHQDLLEIGAAPTANTFGLYITTLKESTKTFDEATEAVKIFHRARTEGVEPSSFLYNALIGKLGKARRIDDCLFYFAEMHNKGIQPTSVTYGTIVNALCRVSDERFAQELFDEMESMPNYKPRPAPYNSLMQFFLTTKRDSSKVLEYYERMRSRNIQPTMHTYKLLIDTYATLEPIDLTAAESVLDTIRASGQKPEAVHYASLIHAKGCVLHDMAGARQTFEEVTTRSGIRPNACLYQALFESMVANHNVKDTGETLKDMAKRGVEITPYIANTLIHGWALEKNVTEAKAIYDRVGKEKREPSTYEAMTRAFLAAELRDSAAEVVREMLSRGYPAAVSGKILELLGHGMSRASSAVPSTTPQLSA